MQDDDFDDSQNETDEIPDPQAEDNNIDDDEGEFETSAENITGLEKTDSFNRKKVLMVICASFAVIVLAGMVFSNSNNKKKKAQENVSYTQAARSPQEQLRSQMSRAEAARLREAAENGAADEVDPEDEIPMPEESALPQVVWNTSPANPERRTNQSPPPNNPPPPQGGGGSAPQREVTPTYLISPLTPRFEGSFIREDQNMAGNAGQTVPGQNNFPQYPASQQNQNAGASFGESGYFTAANALWIGTVIPGVLVTGINTDLPGSIIARVTENIYDSRTGRNLLIPQGSLLSADYSSSVSYAQKRVQIAWNTLIRPDGYFLDLGGMNAVDRKGMSGQEAVYSENWFEYLKAAGIIALFTVANSKMAEDAAAYTNDTVSQGIAQSNAEFVGQMSDNIVSRAMNIQPTLTVDSGEVINILLNRILYLPAMEAYPVERKYFLE